MKTTDLLERMARVGEWQPKNIMIEMTNLVFHSFSSSPNHPQR